MKNKFIMLIYPVIIMLLMFMLLGCGNYVKPKIASHIVAVIQFIAIITITDHITAKIIINLDILTIEDFLLATLAVQAVQAEQIINQSQLLQFQM